MVVFEYLKYSIAHLLLPRRSNNHRPRLLQPDSLLVLSIVALLFFGSLQVYEYSKQGSDRVLGYASNISAGEVISLTNVERARSGLAPLTANSILSAAALAKGQDMFNKQYWAHTAPDGKEPWDFMSEAGYSYQVAGENLARDFSTTSAMVAAWMASPTHRANIMNGRYTEIGIAVINGTLEGVETTLVVQMFGTPRSSTVKASVPTEPAATSIAEKTTTPKPTATPVPSPTLKPIISPTPSTPLQSPPASTIDRQVLDDLNSAEGFGETTLTTQPSPKPSVLAQVLVPVGEIRPQIIFSPLHLTKAFSLAVAMLMLTLLAYDLYITRRRQTVRLVGKNLGHILLFLTVAFLVIFFKGGMVL